MSSKGEILTSHCAQLTEHFDSVQIIATSRDDEGNTTLHVMGLGNWYARFGSVQAWVAQEDQDNREMSKEANDDGYVP